MSDRIRTRGCLRGGAVTLAVTVLVLSPGAIGAAAQSEAIGGVEATESVTTEPGATAPETTEPETTEPETTEPETTEPDATEEDDSNDVVTAIAVLAFGLLVALAAWWMVRREDVDDAPHPRPPTSDDPWSGPDLV